MTDTSDKALRSSKPSDIQVIERLLTACRPYVVQADKWPATHHPREVLRQIDVLLEWCRTQEAVQVSPSGPSTSNTLLERASLAGAGGTSSVTPETREQLAKRLIREMQTETPAVTPAFAAEFEREIVRKVLKDVEALTQGRTEAFWAGVSQAVEESQHRLDEIWASLPTTGQPRCSVCEAPLTDSVVCSDRCARRAAELSWISRHRLAADTPKASACTDSNCVDGYVPSQPDGEPVACPRCHPANGAV